FLGNPPFLGGKRTSTTLGDSYRDWLKEIHPDASSNADLVAFFFRRAFSLLRNGGALSFVATNTIAPGDTRRTGLRWICSHGGCIFAARRRLMWPGTSSVVVSIIAIAKGALTPPLLLDDRPVQRISAYLFHAGNNDDPIKLLANGNK